MLVETFGGGEPSVIGLGSAPRRMVPPASVLSRGRLLNVVEQAVKTVRATGDDLDVEYAAGRRLVGLPLRTFDGSVHGVYVWSGTSSEDVPPRDPAGAWMFDLTTNKISGSDDLLDLYGVAAEARRSERTTAEAFGRLVTNADESQALAKMVRAEVGTEHQAVWTVRRDDDQLRAAHFSCRMVKGEHGDHAGSVVLRGITHDIGAAAVTPAAPATVVLAEQVLAGLAEPGQHRAIVNLRTLNLLRWIDEPMPGLAWELESGGEHWIHPDDLPVARQMAVDLATGKASCHLRFRQAAGSWIDLEVDARLVILDATTNAALLTLPAPGEP